MENLPTLRQFFGSFMENSTDGEDVGDSEKITNAREESTSNTANTNTRFPSPQDNDETSLSTSDFELIDYDSNDDDQPSRHLNLSSIKEEESEEESQDVFDEMYEYLEEDKEIIHQLLSPSQVQSKQTVKEPTFSADFFSKMLSAKVVIERLPDSILKEKLPNYAISNKNLQINAPDDDSSGFYYVVKLQEFSNEKDIKELIYRNCTKCKKITKTDLQNSFTSQAKCKLCKKDILWQCHKCNQAYDNYQSVISHLNSSCNIKTLYQCSKCNYLTKYTSGINKHFQEVHTVKKQIYECACASKFKAYSALKKHLKVCGKDSDLECKYCIFRAKSERGLKLHLIRIHSVYNDTEKHVKTLKANKKSYYCLKCYKVLETEKKKCDECEIQSTHQSKNIPVEEEDEDIKIGSVYSIKPKIRESKIFYKHCIKCGKTCKNSRLYKRHIEHCGKVSSFECDNCTFKTSLKGTLKYHISKCYPHNNTTDTPRSNTTDFNDDIDSSVVDDTNVNNINSSIKSMVHNGHVSNKNSCQIA